MDLFMKGGSWATRLRLASWAGYQSRLGAYGSMDSEAPSDGSVEFIFAPEGRGVEPLTAPEQGLVSWFEMHEPKISQAVKDGIIRWCSPRCTERLLEFDFDDSFPSVDTEESLKKHVGLYSINVHQIHHGGAPYVGYEFGCTWEAEHGLGVLVHGTRIVRIGFADTAFLLWLAKKDMQSET